MRMLSIITRVLLPALALAAFYGNAKWGFGFSKGL